MRHLGRDGGRLRPAAMLAVAGLVATVTTAGLGVSTAPSAHAAAPAASNGVHAGSVSGAAAASASTGDGRGQWVVWTNGGVQNQGDAPFLGDMSGYRLNAPMIGIANDPAAAGYWELGADGG